jgi:hypothetical protein
MKKLATVSLCLVLTGMPSLCTGGGDLEKQSPGQSGSQKKRGQNDPTKNNPDVPHQEPGTDNPDIGTQRHPVPGGTGEKQTGTSTRQAKRKAKPKKDTSADSPKQ